MYELLSNLPAKLFFPVGVAVGIPTPSRTVTVPITVIAPPARLKTSPPTVTRPPAIKVCPATTKLVIGAWISVEKVVGFRIAVAPLTITAFPVGDNEITCPETVTAEPGDRVCDPMMNAEAEFWVNVAPPIRITGMVSELCICVCVGVGVGDGKVMA